MGFAEPEKPPVSLNTKSLEIAWKIMKWPLIGLGTILGCRVGYEVWMALCAMAGAQSGH